MQTFAPFFDTIMRQTRPASVGQSAHAYTRSGWRPALRSCRRHGSRFPGWLVATNTSLMRSRCLVIWHSCQGGRTTALCDRQMRGRITRHMATREDQSGVSNVPALLPCDCPKHRPWRAWTVTKQHPPIRIAAQFPGPPIRGLAFETVFPLCRSLGGVEETVSGIVQPTGYL